MLLGVECWGGFPVVPVSFTSDLRVPYGLPTGEGNLLVAGDFPEGDDLLTLLPDSLFPNHKRGRGRKLAQGGR